MLRIFFRKYVVDALSHMAMGLFASLILGLIIGQLSKIPCLGQLSFISDILSSTSPVVGSCIGLAIAYGLKCHPLVIISSAVSGALGYQFGGPVGAYLAVVLFSRSWNAYFKEDSCRYNFDPAFDDSHRRTDSKVLLFSDQ